MVYTGSVATTADTLGIKPVSTFPTMSALESTPTCAVCTTKVKSVLNNHSITDVLELVTASGMYTSGRSTTTESSGLSTGVIPTALSPMGMAASVQVTPSTSVSQ